MYCYNYQESIKQNMVTQGYQVIEKKIVPQIDVLVKPIFRDYKIIIIIDGVKFPVTKGTVQVLKDKVLDYLRFQIGAAHPFFQFIVLTSNVKICKQMKNTEIFIVNPETFRYRKQQTADIFAKEIETITRQILYNRKKRKNAGSVTNKMKEPYLLWVIILLNCFLWFGNMNLEEYSVSGKAIIQDKNYINLMRYMFFHINFFHLLNNMVFLAVIGRSVIKRTGNTLFLSAYLICGVYAGAFSACWRYVSGDLGETIGASGAIFGILAIWVFLRQNILEDSAVVRKRAVYAVVILIVSSVSQRVDGIAHMAGFVAGLLLIGSYYMIQKTKYTVRRYNMQRLCSKEG